MELTKIYCNIHSDIELEVGEDEGRYIVEACWKCLEAEYCLGLDEGYDDGYEAGTWDDDGEKN